MANITELPDDSDYPEDSKARYEGGVKPANVHSDEVNQEEEDSAAEPTADVRSRGGLSWRRRLLAILFILVFVWLAKRTLSPSHRKPKIIYANRSASYTYLIRGSVHIFHILIGTQMNISTGPLRAQ